MTVSDTSFASYPQSSSCLACVALQSNEPQVFEVLSSSRKIWSSVSTGLPYRIGILNDNRPTCSAGNPHVNIVNAKTTGILEEVVLAPRGSLPRIAAVGANLERFDRHIGIDDLHTKPVFGWSGLGAQVEGTGDIALDELPVYVNPSHFEISQLGETIGQ